MAITVIKDFKIKEAYTKLVENALFSYLWEGIYKPMFEIMDTKPVIAKNSLNVIVEALRNGKIIYTDGGFRAKERFTNAQSSQLIKWGAVWDKSQKMYRLPESRLPDELRVTLAQIQINAERQIKLLQGYLEQVEYNIPYIVESMVFDNEVKTILDDAGNEVKKNVKHLNVIEPELSEQQKNEIAKAYTENMRQYAIKDFAQKRIPELRRKIQELVLKGYRADKVQELIEKEYPKLADKAKFLAQNETTIMLAEYKKVTYQEMGFDKFIWRTITDGRERELHKQLNGTVWRYDDPPIIDERTGNRGLPGQTYNCLVGEMNIVSPFLHNRIFKRKFRGELTTLILPMGTLKVTPNHPILTDKGWVAAHLVNVGDKVAKISNKAFLRAGTNPNDIKITIEEFFSFYSMLFNPERVSHSDFDFHSDISIDNQVDIINIKSKLRDYFKPEFSKLRLEKFLAEADKFVINTTSNRTFYQAFPFRCSASDGFVSKLSKVFSFFFSSEFHTVEHSLRAIAWLDTMLNEICGYNFARDTKFLSQLLNAPAGTIKFYQLIVWELFFNIISHDLVSSLLHSNREMTCTTAETLSDLSQTQPAFIEFDTVIDKIISKSSSIHIYNLENSNNWYLTENYITKNCRCEAIPYMDDTPFDHEIRSKKGYRQLLAKNADDLKWITVKGNHIPITKGQTKEQAVKEFIESKKNSTKSIGGIKRSKPMSFKKANGGNVNPKFYSNKKGYKSNCQTCIAAFEARLRGYDIEALPYNPRNIYMTALGYNPALAYMDTKTGKTPDMLDGEVKRPKDCEDWLKSRIKIGERYSFIYKPLNSASAHIVEVSKNLIGGLKFYDPQNGKTSNKELLKDIAYREHEFGFSPLIFRVDDKEINTEFLNKMYNFSTDREPD